PRRLRASVLRRGVRAATCRDRHRFGAVRSFHRRGRMIQQMLDALADEIGVLDPVSARAELLVAVAHECRDRGVWGGDRALTYWDRLPEKVRAACYAGPSLADWWQRMCT